MPGANPLTHLGSGNQGTDYVQSEAANAASGGIMSEAVPTHLAIILLLAGAGLWGMKKAGFKFVATAGAKGGFGK